MTITLNHTIVPARDKAAAAKFFAEYLRTQARAQPTISRRCGSTRR